MLKKFLRFVGLVVLFAICVIVVFLPMLFLKLIFGLIGCRTTITEEEVYDCLSFTEWKTGLELADQIRALRLEQQPYAALFDSVYPVLWRLEASDLVERRERQISEEQKKIRRYISVHEFRRKPGGKRVEEKKSWFVLPMPVPSWGNA